MVITPGPLCVYVLSFVHTGALKWFRCIPVAIYVFDLGNTDLVLVLDSVFLACFMCFNMLVTKYSHLLCYAADLCDVCRFLNK